MCGPPHAAPTYFLSENVCIGGFKDLEKEGHLGGQSSQYGCVNHTTAIPSLPFLFTFYLSLLVPRNMTVIWSDTISGGTIIDVIYWYSIVRISFYDDGFAKLFLWFCQVLYCETTCFQCIKFEIAMSF